MEPSQQTGSSAARGDAARPKSHVPDHEGEPRIPWMDLVAYMPVGVHVYDLSPDGRLVLAGYNAAAERILGLDHGPLIGKTLEEAFPAVVGTEIPEAYRRAARDGVRWHSEQVDYEDERIRGAYEVDTFRIAPGEIVVAFVEVTEHKKLEEMQRHEMDVQAALTALFAPLTEPEPTLFSFEQAVLEHALRLTGSAHGFVSMLDPVTGNVLGHAMTEMQAGECGMPEEARKVLFVRGEDGRYGGLQGYPLDTRQGFYTNHARSHPSSKGVPEGHIPISRFLSVPVMLERELVGQIALANPERDYTDRDLQAAARLGDLYALALQRRRHKDVLRDQKQALDRRLRALDCLFRISALGEGKVASTSELLQGTVAMIPSAWQYPEISAARIIVEGLEHRSPGFRKTAWTQSSRITVCGRPVGAIDVCYLEERPEMDEGPFLTEERQLIDEIARRLGQIMERMSREMSLRIKDAAIANSINAITISDPDGKLQYVNRSFLELWGYQSEDEVIGRHGSQFYESPTRFAWVLSAVAEEGRWTGEAYVRRKDGSLFPVQVSASRVTASETGDPSCILLSFIDITERQRLERELHAMARQDGLTGLANRREIEQRLEEQWRRSQREQSPISAILLDIDFFKAYNDGYGHLLGDDSLKLVAACVKRAARRPGDIAGRYGGEEFVLLLPGTSLQIALDIAETLRREVEAIKIAQAGHPHGHVTVSAGVASAVPLAEWPATRLIGEADRALYRAKSEGRNCVRAAAEQASR